MNTISKSLFGLGLLLGLGTSCGRDAVSPEPPKAPQQEVPTPNDPKDEDPQGAGPRGPFASLDLYALDRLGLKPLDGLDKAQLPPLPEPVQFDPSSRVARDTLWMRYEEAMRQKSEHTGKKELDGTPRNLSRYMIWGYSKPEGITLGRNTSYQDRYMRRGQDASPETWRGKPYIPITLSYGDEVLEAKANNPYDKQRFDSLTRLHHVVPLRTISHSFSPTPYDLRHLLIAHEGVNISPLFSIRYQDYKEAIRTGWDTWYRWVDVRVSDIDMSVLDWLYDGQFRIYPLTDRYPRFTLILITRTGRVISREIEHQVPR